MRAWLAILSARLRTLLQYRAAAIAGFMTQLFWGVIRMLVFIAFFESTSAPQPMNLDQVIAYIWLGQAFLLLSMLNIDGELQRMIHQGDVAYEMLRPVNLYGLWFARMLAGRIAPIMLRAGPLLLIATLAGWLHWPTGGRLLGWMACLVAAALLSSAISCLMTISMFWTLSGLGISRLIAAAAYMLSGLIVPLPFFPDSWQPVLNVLPFRGLGDVPYRLFSGDLPAEQAPALLAHQLAWTVGLMLLGSWLLSRAQRRLVVQGG